MFECVNLKPVNPDVGDVLEAAVGVKAAAPPQPERAGALGVQVGESSIMFTEFTDLADGCVFLSSNREGDLTDARNRLHHSRRRTKTVYAPQLSLNCLTVAALHLVNLE